MDKQELKYWLTTGIGYINSCLKEGVKDEEYDSLYKAYHKLEKGLYEDARYKLSMTDLVKFETKLRATKKRLDKRFK